MRVHRLVRLIEDGRGVGVHCRQSVGRSGLLAVSIAMAAGMPMDSAIDVVSRARGVRVPETKEQLAWLREHAIELSQQSA
jgi:protein-tyrosine phosphatase